MARDLAGVGKGGRWIGGLRRRKPRFYNDAAALRELPNAELEDLLEIEIEWLLEIVGRHGVQSTMRAATSKRTRIR